MGEEQELRTFDVTVVVTVEASCADEAVELAFASMDSADVVSVDEVS